MGDTIWTPGGEKTNTLGGRGNMDLPFEEDPLAMGPDATPVDLANAQIAGAMVVLAATIEHPVTGRPHPVVIYRFRAPEGVFYQDIVLAVEEHQLQAAKALTSHAVDAAIAGAAIRNEQATETEGTGT